MRLIATLACTLLLSVAPAFSQSTLAATPPMGWNSWNHFAGHVPDADVRAAADALVSSGMRNREVATKLGMTERSIPWYMQQVYDKVGTRRRLQAVERARQFGLIA